MLDIGLVVDIGAKAAEQIDLALVRLQRLQLRHVLVIGADGLGQKQASGQTAAPEVGAETGGNRLARGGERPAVAVQETVQERQRHSGGRAVKQTA